MKENVGRIDRIVRAVVGPALIGVGFGPLGGRRGCWQGLLSMLAGALITETVITGVCPLNALLRLDTRSALERERADREVIARIRERDARAAFTQPPSGIEERRVEERRVEERRGEERREFPGTIIVDTPAG
jgi:hypothetical protein